MAANPNPGGNVYKRDSPEDTHEAWNAVIRKVNEERANPPEDTNCDELDPIDEVEADHIWTKGDIEDLRDAIDEMCEFAWVENLEFWHDSILTEIDDALDREYGGWGDEGECCMEECSPDCPNAVAGGLIETYLGSYTVSACLPCGPCDVPDCPRSCCTHSEMNSVREKGMEAWYAMTQWGVYWNQYCILEGELEDLEGELEILEEQLVVLEGIRDEECAKDPPNRCEQRQQAVDDKQQEVDDKQQEVDEKEVERDEKQAEADAEEAKAEAAAVESMSMARDCEPYGSLYFFGDAAGSEPLPFTECDKLPVPCLGYWNPPIRCQVGWSVYQKTWKYYDWGGVFEYNWQVRMSGRYTRSGQPYVTFLNMCAGVPAYACSSCGPDGGCASGCGVYHVYEVRVHHFYPQTTPEGEECCD